jgi:hypothetical protein
MGLKVAGLDVRGRSISLTRIRGRFLLTVLATYGPAIAIMERANLTDLAVFLPRLMIRLIFFTSR